MLGHLHRRRLRRRSRRILINNDETAKANQRTHLLRSVSHGVSNIGVNVLHDCTISLEEQLVLSAGLNFIPPPRKRLNYLLSEALNKFKRRVRIKNTSPPSPLILAWTAQ